MDTHFRSIELILSSISSLPSPNGLRSAFMFSKPNSLSRFGDAGAEIYFDRKKFNEAWLYVRENAGPHVKDLPIDQIWEMLQDFICKNYWIIADEIYLDFSPGSHNRKLSLLAKSQLSSQIAISPIFKPKFQLTIFPLIPIITRLNYNSENFFIFSPENLASHEITKQFSQYLVCNRYPPLNDNFLDSTPHWPKGTAIFCPSAWLGVICSNTTSAIKCKSTIMGALAVAYSDKSRYSLCEAKMPGGTCTFDGQSISVCPSKEGHTPQMMHNLELADEDEQWLSVISKKLTSDSKHDQKCVRALEYFYRSWFRSENERFPILFMAVDALFGDQIKSTQNIVEGLQSWTDEKFTEKRVRDLMRMRASVIHGGAPDVSQSQKYGTYFSKYGESPIRDMDNIAALSIRNIVFGTAMSHRFRN